MPTLYSVFFLVSLLAVTSCDSDHDEKAERDLYLLGLANNHLAVLLHRKLFQETGANVFFSPFSVASVLAMLYKGARGDTAGELRKVLGYRNLNDSNIFASFHLYITEVMGKKDPKLYTAYCVSAMIVDRSFPVLQQYKDDVQNIFQAYVQEVDIDEESVAAVDRMNTWAKIKTKGTISELADAIDPETTLFLANAAYFNGVWKVQFDPQDTKYHPFYKGTNASQVLMMHTYASLHYYEEEDSDLTAVELFYEGRNMSMVIYLPKEKDGLSSLEEDMTAARMAFVRRHMYFMKVHLTMPKFKLDYDRNLSGTLQKLGIVKIFWGAEADLSGMAAETVTLSVSEVRHKATIEVNEKGSIAAAVTRVIMTRSMPLPIPDPEFNVNHPFLFAIFDTRSGMILFMGSVRNL